MLRRLMGKLFWTLAMYDGCCSVKISYGDDKKRSTENRGPIVVFGGGSFRLAPALH